jgi:ankyrin repeat protein
MNVFRKTLIVIACIASFAFIGVKLLSSLYKTAEVQNFKKLSAAWDKSQKEMDCQQLPVHCAIRDKSLGKVPLIIKKGFLKNALDDWGHTAVFYSLKYVPKEQLLIMTKSLLESGVDSNIPDKVGDYPLSFAIRTKNFELANLLLKHGANPNIRIGYGVKRMTLLNELITQKDQNSAEFLVKNGADLKMKDDFNYDACERAKLYSTRDLFRFCK